MIFDIPKDLKVVNGSVNVGSCEGCNCQITTIIIRNPASGIPTPLIGCGVEKSRRQNCPQPLVVDLVAFEGLRQRLVESPTNI